MLCGLLGVATGNIMSASESGVGVRRTLPLALTSLVSSPAVDSTAHLPAWPGCWLLFSPESTLVTLLSCSGRVMSITNPTQLVEE